MSEGVNQKIYDLMKKQQHGEIARVLFNVLMIHLKAPHDAKDNTFWQLMKEAIKGEQDAQMELFDLQKKPKRKQTHLSKKEGVSTSN